MPPENEMSLRGLGGRKCYLRRLGLTQVLPPKVGADASATSSGGSYADAMPRSGAIADSRHGANDEVLAPAPYLAPV